MSDTRDIVDVTRVKHVHLLQFLVLSLSLLSSCFVCGILQGFDIRAQIFTDPLCEDEVQHQAVYLRLQLGYYRQQAQKCALKNIL